VFVCAYRYRVQWQGVYVFVCLSRCGHVVNALFSYKWCEDLLCVCVCVCVLGRCLFCLSLFRPVLNDICVGC
jgi:hypothetical protein